jgi:hypothetical protein
MDRKKKTRTVTKQRLCGEKNNLPEYSGIEAVPLAKTAEEVSVADGEPSVAKAAVCSCLLNSKDAMIVSGIAAPASLQKC